MIEPRINQASTHPLGRLAPTRDIIEEVLSVFGGPENEGRGQKDWWFDSSFRQLRIVAVVQHQRFGMQHVVADVCLRRERFHHGLPRCLDWESFPSRRRSEVKGVALQPNSYALTPPHAGAAVDRQGHASDKTG